MRWPSGREARRGGHVGEVAEHLARAGLQVDHLNARLLPLGLRHVGDVLRRRRIARRHDGGIALRQVAHIGAVLIHDREPLAAVLLRSRFIDEHHARVEEAAEARHLGIDRIGNDVADAAPEIGIRHVLLAGELLARLDVPQAELGAKPARRIARDAARHERLCAGHLPGIEARRRVEGRTLGKARLVERREIARALQIVRDDAGHTLPEIALAGEVGNGDGHRLELSARPDAERELRLRCGHERHYRHDNSQCDEKTGNEAGNHGMMSQA